MSATGFPSLSFEDATAALAEARQDGVLIFGCGSFARDLHAALVSLGITVRGFVVSRGEASCFAGCPVAPLMALPAGWNALPLWIGVFNREPGANHAALSAACESAGFARPPKAQSPMNAQVPYCRSQQPSGETSPPR